MRVFVFLALFFLLPIGLASAQAPTAANGKILTASGPYDAYHGWLSVSVVDPESGIPSTLRLRGDAWSRFYYVLFGDVNAPERNVNEVRSEDGTLLARVKYNPSIYGARRTPNGLTLFFYHVSITGLSRYDLVMIGKGKAQVYACRIDQPTFEAVAGRHFPDRASLAAVQAEYSNRMIDALQEAEPALTRDHCVVTENGVPRGKPDRRPVLRMAFPRVGNAFVSDGRGFKGGWLYQGNYEFGPRRQHCCAFIYAGDDRDAVIIGNRVRPGRDLFRIRQIFYVEGYVRSSQDCEIDGDRAVFAVADANWRNGRAWLSDGKTVRVVRWTDMPPRGCEKYP